jgi:hypothetical protein
LGEDVETVKIVPMAAEAGNLLVKKIIPLA